MPDAPARSESPHDTTQVNLMDSRMRRFGARLLALQAVIVMLLVLTVPSLVTNVRAQANPASTDPVYLGMVVLAISISVSVPSIAAGLALKSGITAAVSAITERESTFGKALILVALGEALAIYGLIVALMLMSQLPA